MSLLTLENYDKVNASVHLGELLDEADAHYIFRVKTLQFKHDMACQFSENIVFEPERDKMFSTFADDDCIFLIEI